MSNKNLLEWAYIGIVYSKTKRHESSCQNSSIVVLIIFIQRKIISFGGGRHERWTLKFGTFSRYELWF